MEPPPIAIALPMVVVPYSLIALIVMALMAGITASVHCTILAASRQTAAGLPSAALLFAFRWPPVAYALDITGTMRCTPTSHRAKTALPGLLYGLRLIAYASTQLFS